MITDYHTHLRPDEQAASAKKYFTEANVDRYLEVAAERGVQDLGFSEHVHRFRQALDVWRHPYWEQNAVDDLDQYCDFVGQVKASGRAIKLGIEVDWIPGKEAELKSLIDAYPWDYVLGSVHFLGAYAVDHPDYDIWSHQSADEIWTQYFETLGDAAACGLFDILAHPDLVKVWGRKPAGDLCRFYDLAMVRIAEADIAVEVSTAGLRKPVDEIYPAAELLQMFLQHGVPISLSSDAHLPADVGFAFQEVVPLLRAADVDEVCVFEQRARRLLPLGFES